MDSRNTPKAAGEMRTRSPQGAGSREATRITGTIRSAALASRLAMERDIHMLYISAGRSSS